VTIDFHQAAAANRRRTRLLFTVIALLALAVGLTLDAVLDSAPAITILTLGGMLVAFLVARSFGDRLVLASLRARPLDPAEPEHQQLLNIVHEMAVASGLPTPRVLLIPDAAPNALATGADPQHATIAVTSGLLAKLDRAETQGVIAHEMAHIGNRDTRLGVTVAVLVGAIALLADAAWRIRMAPRERRDGQQDGSLVLLPLLLAVAALAPLASRLVAFAISRQREYLADATAVEFTRNPQALANALAAIAADPRPLASGTRGTALLRATVAERARRARGDGRRLVRHPPADRRAHRAVARHGVRGPACTATRLSIGSRTPTSTCSARSRSRRCSGCSSRRRSRRRGSAASTRPGTRSRVACGSSGARGSSACSRSAAATGCGSRHTCSTGAARARCDSTRSGARAATMHRSPARPPTGSTATWRADGR
jgi:heat shock protein HtpX